MKIQRLLYLSSGQMAAYRWQSGVLTHEDSFSSSPEGLRQFAAFLTEHSAPTWHACKPLALLANVAEEGFHIETIPHLHGKDRQSVIQRKQAQAFFNTSLKATKSLGHEKNRRRNERLLLAALTQPAFFEPWLAVLRDADASLSGIHSLPLLGSALLRRLRLPVDACLLLSIQDQSLRQSYFDKGELHFSRLSPLTQHDAAAIARAFAAEAHTLQQYLSSQRLLARDRTVTVHLLAQRETFAAIAQSCVDTPSLHFNPIDITDAAQRCGLRPPPPDNRAEALFLHLLATHAPEVQFADESLRHSHRVEQLRSLLQGAGLLGLAACLLFSGKQLYDARNISRSTAELHAKVQQTRARYDEIVATFPRVTTDNETLKLAMDRYQAQARLGITPTAFYGVLSRAVETEPAIELMHLDWRAGIAEGPELPLPSANRIPSAGGLNGDSESLIVAGSLHSGTNASPRQQLVAFNRFVTTLRSEPSVQVDILQQPFEVESGKALRSDDAEQTETRRRDFRLRLLRRIPA